MRIILNMLRYTLLILILFLSSCLQTTEPEYPEWVDQLITQFKSEPVGNPPQSIWRYEYKEQIVYYVPPQCCDQFSLLYDSEGNVICAPDGGISGTGDGRCSDFFSERKNEKLIWRDPRSG
jgi:hypothetical protein